VRSALLKNFSFLTISNLLMPIASMALVVAISRLGGVEMLGEYSYLLTFFFIGQTCATAGLQIIVTRDVAREPAAAGAYFAAATWIGLLAATVLSLVLLPAFMWAVPATPTRIGLVLTAAAIFPTVVITFGESVLLAFERAADFVVIELIEVAVRAIVATALVLLGYGIVVIATVILACRLGTAAAIVASVRRRGAALSFAVDRERFWQLAREVPIVGAIPIVNAFYWRSDTLLLTSLRGLADVGFYGAATRILDVTRSMPQAYARALYPLLSRLHHDDEAEFRRLCQQSLTWVVAGTVPLSLVISGLADQIITLLYGAQLAPAADGLRVVAWVIVPYALANTLAQILCATRNQAADLKVNLIATSASVLMNLVLIPRWGFVGTAVAAVLTVSLHVSLQYLFVKRRVHNPSILGPFLRIALVGLVAWVALWSTRAWSPILASALSVLVYAVGLWFVGILTTDQMRRAWQQIAARWPSAASGMVRRRPVPKETV
jgi:O-antigen/teichoic acid export membrane protein